MKKSIKFMVSFLLTALIVGGIIYLLGSFCVLSFNISKWDAFGRGFASVVLFFICLINARFNAYDES